MACGPEAGALREPFSPMARMASQLGAGSLLRRANIDSGPRWGATSGRAGGEDCLPPKAAPSSERPPHRKKLWPRFTTMPGSRSFDRLPTGELNPPAPFTFERSTGAGSRSPAVGAHRLRAWKSRPTSRALPDAWKRNPSLRNPIIPHRSGRTRGIPRATGPGRARRGGGGRRGVRLWFERRG
jgi:hypothetical protein